MRVTLLLVRPLAVALALLMLLAGTPAAAMPPQIVQTEEGLSVALDSMRQLATDSRNNKKQKKTTKPRKGLPIKLGKDRRLTVLLMGSDWRRASGGERIDVVMVATIDPLTGRAAVVSIPRDMGGIPFKGGGASGGMRVNSIYYIRYRDAGLPHARLDRGALGRFSRDVGALLKTEIDYWALTRFGTFANLINILGGVRVNVREAVLDTSYHHGRSRGVWFPEGKDYRLKGDPRCKPRPKKCRSALVYARSRHGTMGDRGNNDYRRAERQQDIVLAGVKRVVDDYGSGLPLLGLLLGARQHVETNLPKTAEAAGQLFDILSDVRLARSDMKVFGPSTWAGTASDGTIRPNLKAIRRWVNRAFYKVKPPRD